MENNAVFFFVAHILYLGFFWVFVIRLAIRDPMGYFITIQTHHLVPLETNVFPLKIDGWKM